MTKLPDINYHLIQPTLFDSSIPDPVLPGTCAACTHHLIQYKPSKDVNEPRPTTTHHCAISNRQVLPNQTLCFFYACIPSTPLIP